MVKPSPSLALSFSLKERYWLILGSSRASHSCSPLNSGGFWSSAAEWVSQYVGYIMQWHFPSLSQPWHRTKPCVTAGVMNVWAASHYMFFMICFPWSAHRTPLLHNALSIVLTNLWKKLISYSKLPAYIKFDLPSFNNVLKYFSVISRFKAEWFCCFSLCHYTVWCVISCFGVKRKVDTPTRCMRPQYRYIDESTQSFLTWSSWGGGAKLSEKRGKDRTV